MAYTTINKSTDYFNTKLYSGNGSAQSITGVGFQPDFIWNKARNQAYAHRSFDAVVGENKSLLPNDTYGVQNNEGVTFDSDGFSFDRAWGGDTNQSGATYVAWNWLANGAGSANTDGSRTTTVSVNTTAGFSIGTCASLATNNDTLGHGLGAVPKMIIVKNTQASGNWFVYHASLGNTDSLYLNTNGSTLGSTIWNNTTPTSSVFTMKGGDFATGESLVFYAFAEKKGYSKFGSYVSNNNVDGAFVYTGFKPKWVMVKSIGSGGYNWMMFDDVRQPNNLNGVTLQADSTGAEFDYAPNGYLDFLSNGFKLRSTSNGVNGSGASSYLYMAFGQSIVGSNNIPATAR